MAMSVDDYRAQMTALFPPSDMISMHQDSVLQKLLAAMAAEYARIDARCDDLLDEADPRTCYEMLADWERVCDLPAPCAPPVQTIAERQQAVAARLAERGGQSRKYFIGLAAALGYTVTIDEFAPATVMNAVNDPVLGQAWRFAWRVNAPASTVRHGSVLSGVNEALRSWGNQLLECAMRQDKPAHTNVLFAYN